MKLLITVLYLFISVYVNVHAVTVGNNNMKECLVKLVDGTKYCSYSSSYFKCFNVIVIPFQGSCYTGSVSDNHDLIACSVRPTKLYIKRGSNTSLIAAAKMGEPHSSYFECIRLTTKKKRKSGSVNQATICSAVGPNGAKPVDSFFGEKNIPQMSEIDFFEGVATGSKELDSWKNICRTNSNVDWDNIATLN
eukprot:jgi/Orpsp1_1/1188742/evm.model.d7180000066895.1